MKNSPLFFAMCIALSHTSFAAVISTIQELDEAAVFHYSLISDLGQASQTDPFSDPENVKGVAWVKNSAFVMGGGDEIKKTGTTFENFLTTDPYFKDHFYPCIGGGENRAYGGDTKWGAGSRLFESVPGFWSRPNVQNATPFEPLDSRGHTPSYYHWYEQDGITVHSLQIHSPDDISPAIRADSLEWLMSKMAELSVLKDDEPGQHIVHLHGHRGALFKNLGSSGVTAAQAILIGEVVDIGTDADMHKPLRFWHGNAFFDDAISWYGGIWNGPLTDDTAIAWYNTGIVAAGGYCEFHVFKHPTRVTIQYIDNRKSSRQLVTPSSYSYSAAQDLRPIVKEIDGPVTYIDWNNFPIGPPPNDAEFVSQTVSSDMNPGDTQTVQVTMKNIGVDTWSTVNGHSLGAQNPADNSIWTGSNREFLSGSVSSGNNAVFNFDITAPLTPGMYDFQWQMVDATGQEAGFFGDLSDNVVINVGNLYDASSDAGTLTHNAVNSPASETADKAIDNDANTKFLTQSKDVYLQYQFSGSQQRTVVAYSVTSGNDAEERDPSTIVFSGSINGSTWTTLDSRSGVSFSARKETRYFNVNNNAAYEFYRIQMSHSNSVNMLQVTEVELLAPGNLPPAATSIPDEYHEADDLYTYTVTAIDPEGDTFTMAADTKPTWLSFDTGSGILSGTPAAEDIGNHLVEIRFNDGQSFSIHSFYITVSAPGNDAPVFTSVPETAVIENTAYSYTLTASDVDGDSLVFTAPTLPTWLSFDSGTSSVSGTPGNGDIGTHLLELAVFDGAETVMQKFNVVVFQTPAASNLVLNGSFEEGTDIGSGNTNPSFWTLGNSAVGSGEQGHDGTSRSLKVTGNSSPTVQVVALEQNTDYIVNLWILASNVSAGSVVFDTNDKFDDETQTPGGTAQFTANAGSASVWKEFNGEFNSGDQTSVTLRIFGTGGTNVMVGSAYLDNIVIRKTVADNVAPIITSIEKTDALQDSLYSYQLLVADVDGDAIIYSGVTVPSWLTFDTATGLLSGTPSDANIGDHNVFLVAGDGQASDSQNFTITVEPLEECWSAEFGWDNCSDPGHPGDPNDDPDGDGISNLVEAALGMDPNNTDTGSGKLPQSSDNGGDIRFEFPRAEASITYTVQKSTDLVNWEDYVTVNDSHGAVGSNAAVDVPNNEMSSGKLFLRLKVEN